MTETAVESKVEEFVLDEALKGLDKLVADAEKRFGGKEYSQGRVAQLKSTVSTVQMVVGHLFDEEAREEDQGRKDQVIQKIVGQGSHTVSEAQEAVNERGERF